MTTSAKFWDGIARKYAARPIKDQAAYADTLDRTRSYLHSGDTVMELGCGTGTTALLLADAVAAYVATDISPEMIRIGNEKIASRGPDNVTFRTATAEHAQSPQTTYDAVLAFNLLHLVEDLDSALAQVRTALKPGGYFISKTACLAESGWLIRLIVRVLRLVGKVPFVGFLTIAGLEARLQAHGFDIVETGTYSKAPPSRFIVARKI